MKVRTQDMMQCVEFGDVRIIADVSGVRLCIGNQNSPNVVLAGSYSSEEVAKSVLQEIIYAFDGGQSVFYMPPER